MRDDGELIKDLRSEIAATQLRRHNHTRAKCSLSSAHWASVSRLH